MSTDDRETPSPTSRPRPPRPPRATGDSATSPTRPRPGKPAKASTQPAVWQETLLLLGVAVVLAIVIKALFVQAFYIPSESMEPGLVENDRILVQKWSYWLGAHPTAVTWWSSRTRAAGWSPTSDRSGQPGSPTRSRRSGCSPSGGHLVKRVIGVEGDVITCCDEEGRISVNGVAARRGRLRAGRGQGDCGNGPMTGNCNWTAGPVPEGHLFVMGDHRDQSADSTRAHVHRGGDRVRARPRVRRRGPRRGQGLRAGLAAVATVRTGSTSRTPSTTSPTPSSSGR